LTGPREHFDSGLLRERPHCRLHDAEDPFCIRPVTHSSSTATAPPDSDGIVAISSGQIPSVPTRTSPLVVLDTVPMA